jgi:hypothetical protein
VRRLAALVPPSAVADVTARLKLSNDEAARLTRAATGPAITPASSARDINRALFHDGAAAVMDRMLIAAATHGDTLQPLIARVCAWTPRPLPVGGSDVLALGIAAGPEVGRILAALTDWWIDEAFQPGRDAVLAKLKAIPRTG